MTIHGIAKQVGKSAGWVYARLNDEYAPKRKRDTPDVATEPIEDSTAGSALRGELEQVRQLRASGMTYQEIAQRCGRSIYWVHSRLKGQYQPRDLRTERLFQDQAVIPYLTAGGHTILGQCERSKYGEFILEADVVSQVGSETWVTEVKAGANGHELHTAIGQLMLHRALRPDGLDVRLQVALPTEGRPSRMTDSVLKALREAARIEVLFIPWPGSPELDDGAT
jgi:hypothetical protein